MSAVARGSFTVEMKPQGETIDVEGVKLGRLALDKRFEGDLAAIGKGEMLTALTPVKGSAGYVAIERVTGTLHGRSGGFVFQHAAGGPAQHRVAQTSPLVLGRVAAAVAPACRASAGLGR